MNHVSGWTMSLVTIAINTLIPGDRALARSRSNPAESPLQTSIAPAITFSAQQGQSCLSVIAAPLTLARWNSWRNQGR
jgi:hypothetical protein